MVAKSNWFTVPDPTTTAHDLRRFARRFSRTTGLLRNRIYGVDLSLIEARVIYEVAAAGETTAEAMRALLGIDKGYLSRVVAGLVRRGLLDRSVAIDDRRARILRLSAAGEEVFRTIDQRSTDEMETLIAHVAEPEREELSRALATIDRLLHPKDPLPRATLRRHRIGDMGHVISRHGVLYAREYGWDGTFEGAVADIGGRFLSDHDPARELCLIAEIGPEIAGSATVVRLDDQTAKLRIVYVEPWARGQGLGERLVSGCVAFAREAGYGRMKLWTNDVLKPARRLYERLGFRCIEREAHESFGVTLVGEVWERDIGAGAGAAVVDLAG